MEGIEMRLAKHSETVYCPRCGAGARMTWQDGKDEYCMACKREFKTGKEMVKESPSGGHVR
nr:hypothetical protein [Candidatus Sigynarchaeota archaeon]